METIRDLLLEEISLFSEDGREACEKLNAAYPEELEESVRGHLRTMGIG